MARPTELRENIRRVREEIRKAEAEVGKLMDQSRKGTLDRRKLESGLKKLKRTLACVPPFNPDPGG
jgi:plasmid stabilization system protein ParE